MHWALVAMLAASRTMAHMRRMAGHILSLVQCRHRPERLPLQTWQVAERRPTQVPLHLVRRDRLDARPRELAHDRSLADHVHELDLRRQREAPRELCSVLGMSARLLG